MEDEFLALHVDRVTRVVAPLVPRDRGKVGRQHVDDLAFPFVAPLRAEHCDIGGHAGIS